MSKSLLQELGINFFQSRSESDFNKIYQRMKPSIGYYLRDLLPSQDDREEAMANTFSKVWTKIHMYDPYWNFSTWVYRIARNEALLMLRHSRRNYSLQAMEERGLKMENKMTPVTIQYSETEENLGLIDTLFTHAIDEIANLPENYKIVLQKREIEKMKYEDISTELGWKHNTVRTRIRKGRELLKQNLLAKYPNLVKDYEKQNEEL